MFVSETCITVRYAETDQMGIVHHSNYPVWFEAGRTDFIRKLGMPYSRIEENGLLLPLISLKCEFKGASKYEDEIVIRTRIVEATFTRITFYYEVFRNGAPEVITSGETMHAWTNKDLKPINMRKHSPEIYSLMTKAMEESQ